jgi:hypothetical protein
MALSDHRRPAPATWAPLPMEAFGWAMPFCCVAIENPGTIHYAFRMSVTFDVSPIYRTVDYKKDLAAINRAIAKLPRTRETALKMLAATGMHDKKTGRVKKQFR